MHVSGRKPETPAMGSEEDFNVFCQPCDLDGPRLAAYGYCTNCKEHLCEPCFNYHRKTKMSRNHKLLNKDNMPQTIQVPTDILTTPCPKHDVEVIKFYCNGHEELLCSLCVEMDHPVKYCNIDYIPNISRKVLNSTDYKDILTSVNELNDKCHTMSNKAKKVTKKSKKSSEQVQADIINFKEQIVKRTEDLAAQAIQEIKDLDQDNVEKLKIVEATCNDVTESINSYSRSIKHLHESEQSGALFIELKTAKQKVKDCMKKIQKLADIDDVKMYNFKSSPAVTALLTEKSFGSVKALSCPSVVEIKVRKAKHQGEIYCKSTKSKEQPCRITGMAQLNPDCLVISDWNNKSIKLVDINTYTITHQLQPLLAANVAIISSNEFAVTLPHEGRIKFITVVSGKVEVKHSVKVGSNCVGLSYHKGKLVVTFSEPGRVQIFDMAGVVLETAKFFDGPYYVASNDSCIYVSDQIMKVVTQLNWQCEIIGSYKMDSPSGIALSNEGSVFVCEQNKREIVEISSDCSTGKVVMKDVRDPETLCWCAEQNTLYYTSVTCNKHYDNFIQIVQIS